jgi:streptogramin lyase
VDFDGTSIWTLNAGTNTVSRLDPVTQASITYTLPGGAAKAELVVFDGTDFWTANSGTDNVSRVSP